MEAFGRLLTRLGGVHRAPRRFLGGIGLSRRMAAAQSRDVRLACRSGDDHLVHDAIHPTRGAS